ncbi:unnamed protein product [Mytilus coruscus]|uniref:Uncharacterized protein n=1 Tax=Mytilus coruscus TaxID=42192 RepID=A0A6J8ED48_MYTCO|nr:unnamed protein product [Mytilus coruscus]
MEFMNQNFESSKSESEYLKTTITEIKSEHDEMVNGFDCLRADIDELHERHVDLQIRSMRENLVFSGIPEFSENETSEQTEDIIKDFMKTEMKMDMIVDFQRAHRRLKTRTENALLNETNCLLTAKWTPTDRHMKQTDNDMKQKAYDRKNHPAEVLNRTTTVPVEPLTDVEDEDRVDRPLLRTEDDIIMGIVYIPPENTRYTSENAMSEIEIEF